MITLIIGLACFIFGFCLAIFLMNLADGEENQDRIYKEESDRQESAGWSEFYNSDSVTNEKPMNHEPSL